MFPSTQRLSPKDGKTDPPGPETELIYSFPAALEPCLGLSGAYIFGPLLQTPYTNLDFSLFEEKGEKVKVREGEKKGMKESSGISEFPSRLPKR